MEIDLGKPVVSAEGERVGTVDSLVIDPETLEIHQIIVRQGLLLTTDRIINRSEIAGVEPDGTVQLRLTVDEVNQMPPFVEQEFEIVRQDQLRYLPEAWVTGSGGAPLFWGTGPGGYDRNAPFFAPAPANPPEVEVESNIREDLVVVHEGTDVVGSDGEKVGVIDQVHYNEDGEVESIIVKAGLVFHHDVRIPAEWIEAVTSDTVELRVTAIEAERQGRIVS